MQLLRSLPILLRFDLLHARARARVYVCTCVRARAGIIPQLRTDSVVGIHLPFFAFAWGGGGGA